MLTDPILRSQVDALWEMTVPKVLQSVPQVWAKDGVSWEEFAGR